MKILMVHPHDLWYDPWTIRILELGRGLHDSGHEIIFCHLPRREQPAHPPLRSRKKGDPVVYELKPRQQHFWHNFKLIKSISESCDLIYLQKCFAATALPVLWAARSLNKPIHYDWDDYETAIAQKVEKRRLARFQLWMYEKILPNFASTLTYSSQAIKDLALAAGFPKERMAHLPVGADTKKFHPQVDHQGVYKTYQLNPDQLIILYIGQLEGAAYADQLIEAAPLVMQQSPHCQFVFVGGGEQLEDLKQKALQSSAHKAIHILGYVEADQIPALVSAADICVATFSDDAASRAKSPLKIAEYLSAGKPIVTSNVGEAVKMVKGCGIIVAPNHAKELAEGIIYYANHPQKRQLDGEKARKRSLQTYTWAKGVETLEELFMRYY